MFTIQTVQMKICLYQYPVTLRNKATYLFTTAR